MCDRSSFLSRGGLSTLEEFGAAAAATRSRRVPRSCGPRRGARVTPQQVVFQTGLSLDFLEPIIHFLTSDGLGQEFYYSLQKSTVVGFFYQVFKIVHYFVIGTYSKISMSCLKEDRRTVTI